MDSVPIYKGAVLGQQGSGKTSFIRRCSKNIFTDDVTPKMNETLSSHSNRIIHFFEIPQELKTEVLYSHLENIDFLIITLCCYLTTKNNMRYIENWISVNECLVEKSIPIFIVGTKVDALKNSTMKKKGLEMTRFVSKLNTKNDVKIFYSSSKTGSGIEELMNHIVHNINFNKMVSRKMIYNLMNKDYNAKYFYNQLKAITLSPYKIPTTVSENYDNSLIHIIINSLEESLNEIQYNGLLRKNVIVKRSQMPDDFYVQLIKDIVIQFLSNHPVLIAINPTNVGVHVIIIPKNKNINMVSIHVIIS
jgi:GTPase SAR1 family protein